MNLRTQLILAFGIVASIPLVGGGLGFYAHRNAVARARTNALIGQAGRTGIHLLHQAQAELHTKQRDPDFYSAAEPRAQQALRGAAAAAKQLGLDATEIETIAQQWPGGAVSMADARTAEALANAIVHFEQQVAGLEAAANRRLDQQSLWLSWIIGAGSGIGVLLGASFGFWTSLGVSRHLSQTSARMRQRIDEVATTARQVAGSSQSVARTSAEQAASLDASTGALKEVSATVKQNAERAKQARSCSRSNRSGADAGATEVAQLQTAMQEIATASGNISEIVKSIDEIAFQTNLLALNAAVEAARAGDVGAGFAVVADEVRSLAQRSAAAAKETADKINDAIGKSARGAELADRVGQSLRTMIDGTLAVDQLVDQIAEASAEQAQKLEGAVNAMQRVDVLTQSNSTAADHTATAAQQLDREARDLRHEVNEINAGSSRLRSRPVVPAEAEPVLA